MEYLIFIVYLVLFAWLVTKVSFFTRTGFTDSQLIIFFLLKVMAGIFYGWIGMYYGGVGQMSDTWNYHTESISEYQLLFSDPYEYLTNLLRNPYEGGVGNFLDTQNSWWNDLKGNIFIKLLSVFNIFSFGHYYVNVIFYSFFSLFGPIALYRVMKDVFPGKRNIILLATFLIPSFLYWTSGLHKEGMIFTGLSFVVYVIYFGTKEKCLNLKRLIALVIGLLLVLSLRNFIIVILIPAIIAWLVALKWPAHSLKIFAALYLLFGLLFFTARYISPRFDFPQSVVTKQNEFLQLEGNSTIPIKTLHPHFLSFVKNTPQALTLAIIRPYPSDVRHILSLAAALEINILLFLFVLFLFFHTDGIRSKSFVCFALFFSISLILAIGFSVNNLGAIVRYRSVLLPFLVIPMVAQIDWERIKMIGNKYIINKNNINNSG